MFDHRKDRIYIIDPYLNNISHGTFIHILYSHGYVFTRYDGIIISMYRADHGHHHHGRTPHELESQRVGDGVVGELEEQWANNGATVHGSAEMEA